MTDLALAFYLVLVLPVMQLWRSTRKHGKITRSRTQRYLGTIRTVALTLIALVAVCWWNGHTPSDLGLAPPASGAAIWCLLLPLAGLPLMYYASKSREVKMAADKRAAMHAQVRASDALPRTPAEFKLFLITTLFIGAGWELLYRGYLTLVLTPWLGTWGAVLLGGLAYGAGHGYANPRQLTTSIVTAILFSVAYVVTGNLWWLILVHIGIPLLSVISCYKILKPQPA
ncbi:CPBP family intramembrane metalloprotease [Pseudoduganella sp. FT25W]|uniref:CPBP family intramembrane metalloprotease n=1 Tax=Duganella alba TaxID=2666081 RepID=A0A6L5QLF2_9BURK|nr:CPBP family intramembrane glutamic endopeptidase [Duganella alba]MRX10654.1 CPBP family intramembrane metalloprotease [Duganella alba]MRX15727.1 CPBP family intramembrane metalloprotease [Duganella alba]